MPAAAALPVFIDPPDAPPLVGQTPATARPHCTMTAKPGGGYKATVSTRKSDWSVQVSPKEPAAAAMTTSRSSKHQQFKLSLGGSTPTGGGGGSRHQVVPKFPPLLSQSQAAGEHRKVSPDKRYQITKSFEGIEGNAIGLPAARDNNRPTTARSDFSLELKEMQVKERQYKMKLQSLHKLVEQLRAENKMKQEEIANLNAKLKEMEGKYKILYLEEKEAHEVTKSELERLRLEFEEMKKLVESLRPEHEQKMKDMGLYYEKQLGELREHMKREIAARDDKLNNLKKQMANALRDNSWERQQQLEELTKELNRVSDESHMLRLKLKSLKVKQDHCQNCTELSGRLEEKQKQIGEQKGVILQLSALCKKFEVQLMQQDTLLKQWAEKKGRKVNASQGK